MKRLKDFVKVVTTLSVDDFSDQFPHPFLFYSTIKGAIEGFMHTRLVDTSQNLDHIDRFSEQLQEFIPLLPNTRPNRDFPQKIFIGRDSQRDFTIQHSTVSNRHACLFCDLPREEFKLVDSGSTNGTFVRGRALVPGTPVSLRDGDVVTFGQVNFLFFSPKGVYRYLRQYRMFRDAMQE